jgi:hypothetical protein
MGVLQRSAPGGLLACFALLVCATASDGEAPEVPKRIYETRKTDTPPRIDGQLGDAAWQLVEWSSDFVQYEPAEGKPPARQTAFKLVYDDEALYFAFRVFDDPGKVRSLLARRDRFPGDWIEVNIDSYFDRRTAFSFTLSLSGTRNDEFISNDGGNWDTNWDPVWEGATRIDEEGWTAETRIPLSQLRFSDAEQQVWGLQVMRRLFRNEERSIWQRIPKGSSGWVSRFGEIHGIAGLEARRRVELLPYGVAKAERYEAEPGNPFRDGSANSVTAGLDGKIGVGSNLTLDFTLNPDFGQVEADPSEVNLTEFETFFEERRPFFIEGADIFELPLAPAITGGSFVRDRLFYSRRIGAAPPHVHDLLENEFADTPARTSIRGAFKLSGKTAGGLSVGILDSVTGRERARISALGQQRSETVAPLTNYFVARLQQDLRGPDTQVGLMLTAVHRDLGEDHLDFLPSQAYAAGLDFSHYLGHRVYRLEGNVIGSRLQGSSTAIDEAQRSSARYYQRPDNDHVTYDPTRTSLSGHSGSVRLTRTTSESPFSFQTGVAWRSPGFEVNDVGYMRSADGVNQFTWVAWQFRNPFSIFRRAQINANEWLDWDFGGHFLLARANTNAHAVFRNNFRLGGGLTWEGEQLSNTELRGGPSSRWPGGRFYDVYAGTDSRRSLYGTIEHYGEDGREGSHRLRGYWLQLTYRPTNALTLSLNPQLERRRSEMQYVDTLAFGNEDRFVFGALDQDTVSLTVRLDLALTPNLTIQYYGAPFISSGTYQAMKRITDPQAAEYRDRFAPYDADQIRLDVDAGVYEVDENRDGKVDYRFDRPDFDFRDFNSTLVLRWEYRPGSQLYVVWSQARSEESLRPGPLRLGAEYRSLFDAPPHDIFLVKFSKWFSR